MMMITLFLSLFSLLLSTLPATLASQSPPIFFPRATYRSSSLKQNEIPKTKIPFKTQFFPQILDHFTYNPQSYKIFYQKYLINSQFWHHGAPIFVYTGNEGNIEWFAANTGFLLDIAPKFRALLVFIEHRYYGESMPFGKDSYNSSETVGYLNSQQALADYAVLIRSLKQNLSSEASPVVVFGGSYGGMLAAWFRLKYPHIAIGAWLLPPLSCILMTSFRKQASTMLFHRILRWSCLSSQSSASVSLNCYQVIKESWAELEALSSQRQGFAELSKIFKSCKGLHSVDAAQNWLWAAFIYTAMVNYPTEANFMMHLPAYPVKEMCKIIDALPPGVTKLSKAFAAASLYYNYSQTEKCFNIEHGSDAHGLHGWDWQACTEMVMPMSCSNESMFIPYSYNYDAFAEQCMKKYGVTPRPHWITTEFGGKRIEEMLKRFGSNIIFSNGMQDPWSRGGVLKNISASIVALVTEEGAHHVDFRFATKDDPNWLVEQRRQEVDIIQSWIDEYYADLRP
ncbi:hypothetical protein BT93_C0140 [Corymbia citriodora subsp. variegata]|nr:hypothetical protein BT93_C0140 [Corymbia citriodora subsp. variegata]